jgi:hypothetical protein
MGNLSCSHWRAALDQPFASISGRYDDQTRRQDIDAAVGRRRRATRIANLGIFTGYRIGLDIGNGNVGWCVLFEDGAVPVFLTAELIAAHNAALPPSAPRTQLPDIDSFVPLGTHKFDIRSPDDGRSLSKVRAEARARRKTLDARQKRRWHLRQVLEKHGLYPADDRDTKGLTTPGNKGPVPVKADVLRVLLLQPGAAEHPHDLGRALYNTLKRRGWMKPVGRAGEVEDSHFGTRATQKYRKALETFNCRTVGEFLDRVQRDAAEDCKSRFRKRHRPLTWQRINARQAPKDDSAAKSYELFSFLSPTFELMWEEACTLREAQKEAVPIPDNVWEEIKNAARYRRELKARVPGRCQYLRSEWRCIRALPSFQEFRILQQVDGLRLPGGSDLTKEMFHAAAEHLRQHERMTVRALGVAIGEPRIGLAEKGDPRNLTGARTDLGLTQALGGAWLAIDIDRRDRWVMRFLRRHPMPLDGSDPPSWTEKDEDLLEQDASRTFGEGALQRVDAVAGKVLEDKFANISAHAARLLAEGYRDRLSHEKRLELLARSGGMEAPKIDLYERLPYYGQAFPELTVSATNFAPLERTCAEERQYGRSANPDVHVVLNRVRKVVNAIIDMMGGILPTQVTVEVAREALSEEAALKRKKTMDDRAMLRAAILKDIGRVLDPLPRGPQLDRLVDRWLAAIRQGWRDYDGTEIQRSLLIDGSVYQLDHVVPAAFGEFQQGNLFVSRYNQKKGRRLPWEAFPDFRPELLTFARFGKQLQLEGLKAVERKLKAQNQSGANLKRVQQRITQVEQQLEKLTATGEESVPHVWQSLERTKSNRLEVLLGTDGNDMEGKRQPAKPFRSGEQSALFSRLGPDATTAEDDYQARDVANIGWSTKLACGYMTCLGARSLAVKPWAVHALRCMFNINKVRKDLRNHAVDAFLIAHFDERVMRPAFAQHLHGRHYEELYERRSLELALDRVTNSNGVYEAIEENLRRLDGTLEFIATAHRADNKWNPGDLPGGTFGAFGGQNIYAFRPDRETLGKLSKEINQVRRDPAAPSGYSKRELVALMESDAARINDPVEKRTQRMLHDKAKLRYRQRSNAEEPKDTSVSRSVLSPLRDQPGAYINVDGKFAIASAGDGAKREVIGIAMFSASTAKERERIFATERLVYRPGDTVIYENKACVATGMERDGRLSLYPVDAAERVEDDEKYGQTRYRVPADGKVRPAEKFASDVLGRRLHRRRKGPDGLQSEPYQLFGR